MNVSPCISILIPAYNAEGWIRDALDSALGQTWKNREIIVVNDGSSDHTLDILRAYESERVKVVSQDNAGASRTRNRLLSLAQGDYIQWLDADDILAPDKIELQLQAALEAPSGALLSSSWSRFYFRTSKARFKTNALCQNRDPLDWLQTKMETNAWMAIESWLVSRPIAQAAGEWDTDLTADDDGEYFSRVVAASSEIRHVPEAKSYCRLANPHSLSKGTRQKRWLASQLRSLEKQIILLREWDDSPRSRSAACALLQRWLPHFFPEHPDLIAQCESLAKQCGGELLPPKLPLKYDVVRKLLGWNAAKATQHALPKFKEMIRCEVDRMIWKSRKA